MLSMNNYNRNVKTSSAYALTTIKQHNLNITIVLNVENRIIFTIFYDMQNHNHWEYS